ncbi:Aspartic peptidase [Trema orientale]|uniref:Aspartic peptidase n=1 Tax=Trema orientale TaxID=63057 RepID=A0A2P5FWV0_TREOI|nr:Aspartic peptidase [Trema orientale]
MASCQSSCINLQTFFILVFSSISTFFLVSNHNNIVVAIANSKPPPFTALYMPIKKDNSTLQYYTTIEWGSEENYFDVVIDLGGEFLSLPCDSKNKSTTYRSINCGSTKCRLAKRSSSSSTNTSTGSNCRANDSTCTMSFHNPFNESVLSGRLSEDAFAAVPSDGDRISRDSYVNTSRLLPFLCLNSSRLKGLARGFMETNYGIPTGMIGFGATKMSFAQNLAPVFEVPSKFAICLPAAEAGQGVIFVGGGPYWFDPFWENGTKDASKWLDYTPLFINPFGEYFIAVKSIKIDKRVVDFDTSLLSLNKKTGVGGTKISTSTPYAVLRTSIYKAVVDDFVESAAARNITRVVAMGPFGTCFNTKNVRWSKAGPRVPVIDLELEGSITATCSRVTWRINGANSMVRINKNVMCLGFIDGGSKAKTSIVIGGLQLEDNLLEFDLKTSRLGFTSSFLPRDTSCSTERLLQPDD